MAEFKPLLGPMDIGVWRHEDAVVVEFRTSVEGLSLPATLSLFELAYIVECARTYTAEQIVLAGVARERK